MCGRTITKVSLLKGRGNTGAVTAVSFQRACVFTVVERTGKTLKGYKVYKRRKVSRTTCLLSL
jgi:hypothetical protein